MSEPSIEASVASAPSTRAVERPRVLVVGTALTERDAAVVTAAVRLAVLLDASVLLVHALDAGSVTPSAGRGALLGDAWTAIDRESARASGIDRDGHVVVRVAVAEGHPSEVLHRFATETPRAWMVVGAGSDPTRLGETARELLRRVSSPVVVVPGDCTTSFAGAVLAASDGTALGTRVVQAAALVASVLDRGLEVVRVGAAADDTARDGSVAIAEHAARASSGIVVLGADATLGCAALACTSPVPVVVIR